MESALRTIPATAVLLANIWLVWLAVVSFKSTGAGSSQADFELSLYLFKVGLPVFVFSVVVFIGTFLSKAANIGWWRRFWGGSALVPLILFMLLFTVF